MRNLIGTHLIEIVWNRELPRHKSEAAGLPRDWGVQCNYFDQGLASLRDDKWLAMSGFLDKARKMGLGFMNVHSLHNRPN